MRSFKEIAHIVLQKAGKPLHYRELTSFAIKEGLLKSVGKTPWATMNAQLARDMKNNGENSRFYRTEPGYYAVRDRNKRFVASGIRAEIAGGLRSINKDLNTKQKGDIAEARVAELITLYGSEGLSCYRPMSDDEGIDIIVKKRNSLDVVYVQVKSTYGYKDKGFVSTVKDKSIVNKARMLLVFVYFDLSEGDLFDQVFCIPGPEFLKLTHNEKKKQGARVFTVGLNKPDKSKYAEFMIEKRELANRILEIMAKL